MPKYIFITGGVLSSLGKGVTAASIGALLEEMGYKINFLKLDPYLNVDPGTMNPYQHGEVFVTDDGAETDLDLGHYERFTTVSLKKNNSITAGKIYSQLIEKERRGEFLGGTIQTIPHMTNEIKSAIHDIGRDVDIAIIEIGGTVGDIESWPFIESIRQIGLENKGKNCVFIHLTYVPYIETSDELKTKPTQHSVRTLLSLGIQPEILICRSPMELPENIKKKIALFTNVEESNVISAPDLESIYELPLKLAQQNLHEKLINSLELTNKSFNLERWKNISYTLNAIKSESGNSTINIAIAGKYVELKDAYKSIIESFKHAQIETKTKLQINWIDSEKITDDNAKLLFEDIHGILVPGGFGLRGIEGKIKAVQFARQNNIPFFGICLGMQVAVIEFARNVLKLENANSTEFDPNTEHSVVDMLEEQKKIRYKGATMRLGNQDCKINANSLARKIYQKTDLSERHRHRYEFNPAYADKYATQGLQISAMSEDGLPEIIEIPNHPFFIACQFHPEFKSKVFAPHPLFVNFVKAAKESFKD